MMMTHIALQHFEILEKTLTGYITANLVRSTFLLIIIVMDNEDFSFS